MTGEGVDVERVRAWAHGDRGMEAAVELLHATGLLPRYVRTGPPLMGTAAFVDFAAAAADVWPGGHLPAQDRAVVAVAVSLAGVGPVVDEHADSRDAVTMWRAFSLAEVLPVLDAARVALVLAAMAPTISTQQGRTRLHVVHPARRPEDT